jgi:hypothetical protein
MARGTDVVGVVLRRSKFGKKPRLCEVSRGRNGELRRRGEGDALYVGVQWPWGEGGPPRLALGVMSSGRGLELRRRGDTE